MKLCFYIVFYVLSIAVVYNTTAYAKTLSVGNINVNANWLQES